jgi:hypothetical protein
MARPAGLLPRDPWRPKREAPGRRPPSHTIPAPRRPPDGPPSVHASSVRPHPRLRAAVRAPLRGDVQPHPGGGGVEGVHPRGPRGDGRGRHTLLLCRDFRLHPLRAPVGTGERSAGEAQALHRRRLPRLGGALRGVHGRRLGTGAPRPALRAGRLFGHGLVAGDGDGARSTGRRALGSVHGPHGGGAHLRRGARRAGGRLPDALVGTPRPGGRSRRSLRAPRPGGARPARGQGAGARRAVGGDRRSARRPAASRAPLPLPLRRPPGGGALRGRLPALPGHSRGDRPGRARPLPLLLPLAVRAAPVLDGAARRALGAAAAAPRRLAPLRARADRGRLLKLGRPGSGDARPRGLPRRRSS